MRDRRLSIRQIDQPPARLIAPAGIILDDIGALSDFVPARLQRGSRGRAVQHGEPVLHGADRGRPSHQQPAALDAAQRHPLRLRQIRAFDGMGYQFAGRIRIAQHLLAADRIDQRDRLALAFEGRAVDPSPQRRPGRQTI